jgi:hypothetical protein
MRTWMKNGARMTVVATAFAAAGVGLAFSHSSAQLTVGSSASHAVIRLTAAQRMLGCGPEEATSPADIPAQDANDEGPAGAKEQHSAAGDVSAALQNDGAGTLGATDPSEETANPANIPASGQADDDCGTFSTFAGMPASGHGSGSGHHGSGTGHHGSGTGHHGSGTGHHGSGTGHHGSGAGHHGSGTGHHSSGSSTGGHGKYRHHPSGGMGASTGARQAGSGSSSASAGTSSSASASASDTDATLPTTGAPIAGLLGLAVAALAAGLVARRLTRRGEEPQPEEA